MLHCTEHECRAEPQAEDQLSDQAAVHAKPRRPPAGCHGRGSRFFSSMCFLHATPTSMHPVRRKQANAPERNTTPQASCLPKNWLRRLPSSAMNERSETCDQTRASPKSVLGCDGRETRLASNDQDAVRNSVFCCLRAHRSPRDMGRTMAGRATRRENNNSNRTMGHETSETRLAPTARTISS